MRIATNQMITRGLNSILNQQQIVNQLQQQISTGKKVSLPSDDPVSAARIDLLKQRISVTERLQKNKDAAVNQLSNQESVLNNIEENLQRVRQLQIQSGNTTLGNKDRAMLAQETQSLLQELEGLANTRDTNGRYMFSGSQTLSKPVSQDSNGNYVYNGDDSIRYLDISSGSRVALNDTASDLFMRVFNGNGRFSVVDNGVANTGGAYLSTGSVIDEGAYVEDDYTLSFAQNSGGETVVMVSGATSGNIIPVSGAADDAPVYTTEMTLQFHGIEIDIKGDADVGDDFLLQPSRNESVFSTVQRMVANLNVNISNESGKAQIQTENNQILAQLDAALEKVFTMRSSVGTRLSQTDVANNVNEDFILTSKTALSSIEDADLAETAVKLNSQMIVLQAAQQSFTRIQNLSLFNYL